MSWIRNLVRITRERRQAERDYRALCDEGRAPILCIDLHIHPDDPEWSELHGITGIKTTIPLTRGGRRYVASSVRTIRATCIRELIIINRQEAQR